MGLGNIEKKQKSYDTSVNISRGELLETFINKRCMPFEKEGFAFDRNLFEENITRSVYSRPFNSDERVQLLRDEDLITDDVLREAGVDPSFDLELDDKILGLKLLELGITMNYECVVPRDVQFRLLDHKTPLLQIEALVDRLGKVPEFSNSIVDLPLENHVALSILHNVFQPVQIELEDLVGFVEREIDILKERIDFTKERNEYFPLLKELVADEFKVDISLEEDLSLQYSGVERIIISTLQQNPELYYKILHKALANCVSARYIWALKASKSIANMLTAWATIYRDRADEILGSVIYGNQLNMPLIGKYMTMFASAGPQISKKLFGDRFSDPSLPTARKLFDISTFDNNNTNNHLSQ